MDSSVKGSGKTIKVGDPVYILGNVSSAEEAAAWTVCVEYAGFNTSNPNGSIANFIKHSLKIIIY